MLDAGPFPNQPAEGPNLGPAGTYIGPVHDIDNTGRFAAVLVPHPNEEHMLVWVNVWAAYTPFRGELHQDVTFCKRVPKWQQLQWEARGWRDQYLPMLPEQSLGPFLTMPGGSSNLPNNPDPP